MQSDEAQLGNIVSSKLSSCAVQSEGSASNIVHIYNQTLKGRSGSIPCLLEASVQIANMLLMKPKTVSLRRSPNLGNNYETGESCKSQTQRFFIPRRSTPILIGVLFIHMPNLQASLDSILQPTQRDNHPGDLSSLILQGRPMAYESLIAHVPSSTKCQIQTHGIAVLQSRLRSRLEVARHLLCGRMSSEESEDVHPHDL